MEKTYRCGDIFPLEFTDGQQVETGEEFKRDFEKTSGLAHEQWLLQLGHIAVVTPPSEVTKTPMGPITRVVKE